MGLDDVSIISFDTECKLTKTDCKYIPYALQYKRGLLFFKMTFWGSSNRIFFGGSCTREGLVLFQKFVFFAFLHYHYLIYIELSIFHVMISEHNA